MAHRRSLAPRARWEEVVVVMVGASEQAREDDEICDVSSCAEGCEERSPDSKEAWEALPLLREDPALEGIVVRDFPA